MSDWNPPLYSRFEAERTRPATELLARVPLEHVGRIVDLGCGPGNSTELLARRYPGAQLVGVDTSESMLTQARARLPGVRFERVDVCEWRPTAPPDLLFANAVLQWLPSHELLFPRLLAALRPGGVLALQMPDNRDEPTHRLMRAVAAGAPFAALIGEAAQVRVRIESPERYYNLLAATAEVDLWRTVYYHRLADAAAIVQWVSATGLRPFLQPLSEPLRAQFLGEYQQLIETAYPPQSDGQRLLRFPRLFLVARRHGAQ